MTKVLDNINLDDCGICYRELVLNQDHILTRCGHIFCVNCLLKWYNLSNNCPICRAKLNDEILDNPEIEDNPLENIYQEDEVDYNSIYTGDSDDGRFDTIDDYLADDYTWTGIVEEDDLQITTINPEVINQISILRQIIINHHRYNIYNMCILLPNQFNGNIIQKMVSRDKYLDSPVIYTQYESMGGDYYNYIEIYSPYDEKNIYEIVMKNIDDTTNEVHHFCKIKGRRMVNNHFIQNYNDGTSFERCSLEYAFEIDIFSPNILTNGELSIETKNKNIMFKDIRRLYKISPIFELDNDI
jgi:hypothetical protein